MDDTDLEAFENWYASIYPTYINVPRPANLLQVWQAACEYKQKETQELIEKLEWAFHTINDKLTFGLPEEQAIIRREHRIRGVLRDVIKELKELK